MGKRGASAPLRDVNCKHVNWCRKNPATYGQNCVN